MKVITTAIASVLMLGRRLSVLQWVSLLLLTLGMVVMQLPGATRGGASGRGGRNGADTSDDDVLDRVAVGAHAAGRIVPHNTLGGAGAMLLATVLSAYAGVFTEKLFKTIKLTLWLQSVQLSLFSMPVSCLCMLAYDYTALANGQLLVGFNAWAWLTVALSAVGGIAVSMALKCARMHKLRRPTPRPLANQFDMRMRIPSDFLWRGTLHLRPPASFWCFLPCSYPPAMLLNCPPVDLALLGARYADNILKTFAVGISIVLNCAISSAFLGVPLTLQVCR